MNERDKWNLYFLTIVGWAYHPGHKHVNDDLTGILLRAKHTADLMLDLEKNRWDGWQQHK